MPTRDSMQAYYAARAPYYDDVYDKPERREDISFLRGHLPATFAGRTVLEVACGTGYWTQHIAPAASAMTATDAVAEPLELAKGRPGVQSVRFAIAYAYDLFVSEWSQCTTTSWTLHFPGAGRHCSASCGTLASASRIRTGRRAYCSTSASRSSRLMAMSFLRGPMPRG